LIKSDHFHKPTNRLPAPSARKTILKESFLFVILLTLNPEVLTLPTPVVPAVAVLVLIAIKS